MTLARLRFPAHLHGGRRYPEPDHPYRNDFQRDRDRIVHARAFRRLEGKTQVFAPALSDHFRNRLTHTIEVAQIARTVAASLGLDEDFTEALALAHDIGHPPFAHAGEEELDRLMRDHGGFDHNRQALRIVERFELRYARFPGLNLSFAVREGMVKHSRDFAPGEIPELDAYLPGLKPPLEGQLIDWADECAYNTADLDDGYAAGLFRMEEIAEAIPAYAELMEEITQSYPGADEKVQFQEVLRRLVDVLVTGLIEGTAAAAAGFESIEEIRRAPSRVACLAPEAAAARAALKSFLFARVYSIAPLQEERQRATASIARVFEFLLQNPDELPESHQDKLDDEPRHRVVCDYIAGMTDAYLRRTEVRLFSSS